MCEGKLSRYLTTGKILVVVTYDVRAEIVYHTYQAHKNFIKDPFGTNQSLES